jgi:hypothetical protein
MLKLLFNFCLIFCFGTMLLAQEEPKTYDPNATAESLGLTPFVTPDDFYPIYPWDQFPQEFKPYETLETSLPGVRECGFNLAGFIKPQDLNQCDTLGLKAIVMVGGNWKEMSDENIDARIKEFVEKSKGHDCVIGYYLVDEPGAKSFPALGKAVAAVKKYDPGKLAYINLFPSYATTDSVKNPNSQLQTKSFAEYLERYVQEVKPQFISYDNYMVEYSDDMQDVGKASVYYADLLQIREIAQKYKLPFWNIVSCNKIQGDTPSPSAARFAFQAYTTLAAGGSAIGWFIYYHRPNDFSYSPIDAEGRRTESWQYLQAINKHIRTLGPIMNKLDSTGVYFTSPTPVPNLPTLSGKLIKNVTTTFSPRGFNKAIPAVMVGEFSSRDGNDYVMLVNCSLAYSVKYNLDAVKTYQKIEKISPIDGLPSPTDFKKFGEWILPGHGVLLKMIP